MFSLSPITLTGAQICLAPLTLEDVEPLLALAIANTEQLKFMAGVDQRQWYLQALEDLAQGVALPLVLWVEGQRLGITRYADIMSSLPACEIGWTWLDQSLHGSGCNTQVKYLMLEQAFERWAMVRVQLKTALSNKRSQRAIEKLGAQKEGVLRNHRRLADGSLDDTVMYSITQAEWPQVRAQLRERLQRGE